MAFKHGHELTQAIRALFLAGPADLAVAYWGNDACAKLELPTNLEEYRIACDAFSGFCSPRALKTLLERGAKIVDVPMLHAKVYRTATAMVVASANASSRGLSLDELVDHGLEAGIADTDTERLADAKAWFEKVFWAGTPITAPDLPAIGVIWDRQRSSRMLRTTLVDAILTGSASLIDRKMRVYLYAADSPSRAVQSAYKKTPYYDSARWNPEKGYPFFWGEMSRSISKHDELLCFEIEHGTASTDGVWKILDKFGAGDKAIWPAQLEPIPFGRSLGATDELDRRVTVAVREGRLDVHAEPIALDAFAAIISDATVERDYLALIESAETRAAYTLLRDRSNALGLITSYKSGKVPAVKWHDAHGRYVFSFIPNKGHLLFYVRKAALDAAPELAVQACGLGLDVDVRAKETTLHIRTSTDATALTEWLKGVLPLS